MKFRKLKVYTKSQRRTWDYTFVPEIRLQGKYIGRIFHPAGYEGQDISAAEELKQLADETFSACQGDCWAGGDTGGWFGIP